LSSRSSTSVKVQYSASGFAPCAPCASRQFLRAQSALFLFSILQFFPFTSLCARTSAAFLKLGIAAFLCLRMLRPPLLRPPSPTSHPEPFDHTRAQGPFGASRILFSPPFQSSLLDAEMRQDTLCSSPLSFAPPSKS